LIGVLIAFLISVFSNFIIHFGNYVETSSAFLTEGILLHEILEYMFESIYHRESIVRLDTVCVEFFKIVISLTDMNLIENAHIRISRVP